MHLEKSNEYMNRNIINPLTGRKIAANKGVYKKLLRDGYVYDSETNSMIKPKQEKPPILDEKVPAIGVEPMKPTPYQRLKNTIIKKSGKIAEWLLNIATHRIKDNTKIADWILNHTNFNKKEASLKIRELIELSEKTVYNNSTYWILNMPHSECEDCIQDLLKKER
ncbi:MAG TPA: hypothetical protein VKR58_01245, partial [Aquella sp.]|nr:hypothetical protein [Aquella sp.]